MSEGRERRESLREEGSEERERRIQMKGFLTRNPIYTMF